MIAIVAFEQTVQDLVKIVRDEFPSYVDQVRVVDGEVIFDDELAEYMIDAGWEDEHGNIVIDGETFVPRWISA